MRICVEADKHLQKYHALDKSSLRSQFNTQSGDQVRRDKPSPRTSSIETMDIVVAIERITLVRAGSMKWTPQTQMVGDVECVELCPNDKGFVSLVAETASISLKGMTKMHPSLANVEGFIELKELRDKCQVDELQGSGRKSMFAEEEGAEPARKRRIKMRLQHLADRRASPEMFTFEADGMPIEAQRPLVCRDKLVLKLDKESIENAVKFIVSKGVTQEYLLRKRQWRRTGQRGVWRFANGRYTYKKTTDGFQRIEEEHDENVDPQDADQDIDETHGVDVIGEGGLQAARSSEEDQATGE